ncbi:MAG: sugar-transfer associated ATP-grasp domain-containing protein [Desulfurivibrionaceae bacterium]
MKILNKLKYYLKLSVLRQKQGHTNVPIQLFEMLGLFLMKGIGPGYYHSAQLWHKDKTWKYKLGWISEKKYRKRVYQYNPRPYQKISQNKLPEKALLTLFKMPTAECFGYFHPLHGRDFQGRPFCCGADVLRLLSSGRIERFCIKELEGWGGRGFQAFEVIKEEGEAMLRPMQGGQAVLVEDYFNGMSCPQEGLVFEDYIEQHHAMSSLNPTSLNTIRVFVVWPYEDDHPQVVGAFVRIGRVGSLVDNTTTGGLAAPVEIDTGRIGCAHFKPPHSDVFASHPDHGAQIEGVTLPYWDDVKKILIMTMPLFPYIHFGGFDVAISTGGPMIVELNVEPDKSGAMQINKSIEELIPK